MFKVTITLATETMEFDQKEQAFIGYDPDSYQDCGVVETLTAGTIEELKTILNKKYGLKNADTFDNRIELQFDGEYHYNTPMKDRIPFHEIFTIYLEKVESTELDASILLNK